MLRGAIVARSDACGREFKYREGGSKRESASLHFGVSQESAYGQKSFARFLNKHPALPRRQT
jgi:hypothetical protein